jgi:uncharacterized membrane protein YagU involved in acid resistance
MISSRNSREAQANPSWVRAALAGLVATLPMTIFMLVTQRFLPRGQRYDLPPEIITKELANRAHVRLRMSKRQILAATLVSHFGYGAAVGILYSPMRKMLRLPALAQGILLGLLVWAGSYLGLLPMLGMSASGHREPGHRNLMMIAAHVIWGAALAGTAEALRSIMSS